MRIVALILFLLASGCTATNYVAPRASSRVPAPATDDAAVAASTATPAPEARDKAQIRQQPPVAVGFEDEKTATSRAPTATADAPSATPVTPAPSENKGEPGAKPHLVPATPATVEKAPTAKAEPATKSQRPGPATESPARTVKTPPDKAPSQAPSAAAPAGTNAKKESATPAPAKPAALDVKAMEKRLKETSAIGIFTKLTLKNQVDDLLARFRAYYEGRARTTPAELRQPYDLLILKVLALLQDGDPTLARTIAESREAIWSILTDPAKFKAL